METFNQLQEMDDDEDEREFSRGIIWTYFEQVPEKFDVIEESLSVHTSQTHGGALCADSGLTFLPLVSSIGRLPTTSRSRRLRTSSRDRRRRSVLRG